MPRPFTELERGLDALERSSLFEARAALSRAVDGAPFDFVARHNLAVVLRLRGELAAAWTHADAAVTLCASGDDHRAFAAARAHLALLDRLMGERERAERGLLAALRRDPEHRVSLAYQGLFARLDGLRDDAVERWRLALLEGARAPLPTLVRARIGGMIDDALAVSAANLGAVERCASAVGAISELLMPEGEVAVLDAAPLTAVLDPTPAPIDAIAGLECSLDEAADILHRARRIVVLTGAGCSAESGLATRKDLWKRFDKDDAVSITHGSFAMLWRVIADFLGDDEPQPNPAHEVIASLPRVAAIITQNVDDLHQRAARDELDPVAIIELHGTLERTLCHDCGAPRGARARALLSEGAVPLCPSCGRRSVRPDVVLFGEWVSRAALDESARQVSRCDVLLVVGCAMDVAPAAELPRIARANGATVIEVKRSASRISTRVGSKLLRGTAATVLPALYGALAEREDVLPLRAWPRRADRATDRVAGAVDVLLPVFDGAAVDGTIARWNHAPGARVRAGEPLCEVDLDKVTVEIPSPASGTLRAVIVPAGQSAPAATVLARIETAESDAALEPFRWQRAPAARVEDPLVAPLGPHTDVVRALLQQVASAPMLQPDAALAALDPEAQRFIGDRADELSASLALVVGLRVELFRDPLEAARAEVDRWRGADAEERARPWARLASGEGARTDAALTRAVDAALRRARDRSAPRLGPFATMPALAFSRAARGALASVANEGASGAGPWGALLALWLRGAWPFALPNALGVWVPLHDRGALVAPMRERRRSATGVERPRWPRSPAEWYSIE